MKMLVALLIVMVTVVLNSNTHAAPTKHYAGEIPSNRSVEHYLMVCSVCGSWYGGSMERNCITDKTFETFYDCETAIIGTRRK